MTATIITINNMGINNSGKEMFDRIKILFFGTSFDFVEIYQFNKNDTVKKTLYQESILQNKNTKRDLCSKRIVGLEIEDTNYFKERLVELLREIPMASVATFYFVVKKRKQLPFIMLIIKKYLVGEFKLYGIDPDYFFSLVPLSGKGHINIENYILDLKQNYSVKDKVKQMIKKLLVYLQLYHRLYEAFIVVIQPT